ncbi:tripartite-type tricarboxylate transporter receptor subunit TctC [Hoeflea marina]|uniref:Tripartite-type tricarboxylate transporter receptor subunit TctC n=1 Tax=Hoeflea marina TaxID=274592 RepID=A0A317PVQ6_9HYPH|nr:tripartite tricarboxylate transporter substrate-binding protein [Hoeflea marina]PWW03500.1 tripartite-type tricarboxylate transporter receptor subunit TctC [Hoeflea marina]
MADSIHLLRALGLAIALGLTAISGAPSAAETVTLKVGYGPGGGFDTAARFVAEHLGAHLPGHPEVAVQNVDGAGSLKLARMLAGTEPKDGSVIGLINPSLVIATVTDPGLTGFDANSLNWIGSLSASPTVCLVGKASAIASVDEFLGGEFLLGASGKASSSYVMAALVKNSLHARFRLVTGFKGSAEINLAIERGEIEGWCGTSLTSYHATGAERTMRLIGRLDFSTSGETADLPALLDRIADGVDRDAAGLVIGYLAFQLPLVLPAGTPPDIVDTHRRAFDAMIADPAFVEAALRRDIRLSPKNGASVEAIVRGLTDASPAIVARAAELIR